MARSTEMFRAPQPVREEPTAPINDWGALQLALGGLSRGDQEDLVRPPRPVGLMRSGGAAKTHAPVQREDPEETAETDEGGPATRTDLEQDMNRAMDNVLEAQRAGVSQFVNSVLATRLAAIESGSWNTFLQTMAGGTAWAAAVFPEARVAQFGISMVGMTIQALTTLPTQSQDALPQVEEALHQNFERAHAYTTGQTGAAAAALLAQYPATSRYQAMARFLEASLRAEMRTIRGYSTLPQVNQTAVRQATLAYGQDLMDRFCAQVQTLGEAQGWGGGGYGGGGYGGAEQVQAAWITYQGERKLAQVRYVQTYGVSTQSVSREEGYQFMAWILPDLQDAALAEFPRPGELDASQVSGIP